MIEQFINLMLEKLDDEKSSISTLHEILEQSSVKVIVILGAPGSGKSSILKNYQANHQETADIYNVKNFIELPKTTTKQILFLDGLDEFRNTSKDKVFVIEKLGSKISTLDTTKVVISCREMDWYGDDDKKALKDEIKTEVEIYRILPLNYSQQLELATNMQINNPEKFVESLSDKGLISNPQMFVMIADLYIKNPELKIAGKSGLYKEYIKYARENNLRYKRNSLNILSEEEIFKFGGYLASFYIFSNIDKFDETILENIANTDFFLDKLITVSKSNLFNEQFRHRTIIEFLAGNYLANNVLNTSVGLDVKRVKSLFTDSNKIPTELRGTYAWLCSISKNHELIAVDPYYQAVHGDNALFDIEQKKEIIRDIKIYAQTSPYFYKFNHHLDLQGFYDARLEEFFVEKLDEAVKQKNHYLYFICAVLEGATELGKQIRKKIKEKILDNSIVDYYRDNLIQILNDEDDFLVEVLNKIKNDEINDEKNYLKEAILRKLYPNVINSENVGQYLQLYHNDEIMSHCYFLDKTPYEKQKKLVDEIHQFSIIHKNGEKQLLINESLKHFVDKYFLDTVLKFEDGFNSKEIYEIFKYFKSTYYKEYESIDFDKFTWRLKDGQYNEKIQKLANELYKFYIQDKLKHMTKDCFNFFDFQYFFGLQIPNDPYEILLSFMSNTRDYETNKLLFLDAISYAPRDEEKNIISIDELKEIAKKFGLEKELELRLNPPKAEWEIDHEKRIEKQRKKEQEELEANEEYFAKRNDEEIQKSFNDLYWFSKFVYFEREKKELKSITQKTYERLKEILRRAIYSELIEPELLTIQHLAEKKDNNRNIDQVYYTALALNNDNEIIDEIKDNGFLKYLYINSLLSSNVGNIKKANFYEKVDASFALSTQKEYISVLVSTHISELENTVTRYIKNETDIQTLKILAMTHGYGNQSFQDKFIDNFLSAFHFNIFKEDLAQLKLHSDESNRITIKVLECFIDEEFEECKEFSMAMAIAMYEVFNYNNFRLFNLYPNPKRVLAVSKMMSAFNTEESIKSVNGIQSQKNICADFLRNQVLKVLKLEECKELLKYHENNIWTNPIKHAIDEKKQASMDTQGYGHYPIEFIKDFLLKHSIVSKKDFFEDVCIRLNNLATRIKDSRDNQKDKFYNIEVSKDENSCRDILLNDLKLLYENEWLLTREAYEANDKRVDINIKYKNNNDYEVQIECKKDKNKDLSTGIQTQLINHYFSSNVQYGIYLVFYFGESKKTAEQILKELEKNIPEKYVNNIKIILIDLQK